MMVELFYALGILAAIFEISIFLQPKRMADLVYVIDRENKKDPEDRHYTPSQSLFIMLYLGYIVWTFLGLFTSSWPIFLFMLVVPMLLRRALKIKSSPTYFLFDGFISGFLWAFVVFNHFVLKLNLSEVTLGWILSLFV